MHDLTKAESKELKQILEASGIEQLILAKTLDLTVSQVIACLTHKKTTASLILILTRRYRLTPDQIKAVITENKDNDLRSFLFSQLPVDPEFCRKLHEEGTIRKSKILDHPNCPRDLLFRSALAGDFDAICNPSLLVADLDKIQKIKGESSFIWLANNPNCRANILARLYNTHDTQRRKILEHPNCPQDILNEVLVKRNNVNLLQKALTNPKTNQEVLREFYPNKLNYVEWILKNPSCPSDLLLNTVLTPHSEFHTELAVRHTKATTKLWLISLNSKFVAVQRETIIRAPVNLVRMHVCI